MQTPSVVEYSSDAQIDVFDTRAFAENQVDDTCEHARACNLGCHSRTHFQRKRKFTHRHPFFSVNSFDHHTTSTSAIVLETAVPKSFHHLPRLGVISSVDHNFSLSLCANVGPVFSFLIVFSMDMFHEAVNVRNRFGDILFPP